MAFFSSLAGQYVVQVLAHSVLMVLAVEVLLRMWQITRPGTRLQFRLLYLLVPLLGWPLYQLLWPARGSAEFRETVAIIDTQQWLPLWLGGVPGWGWVVGVMGLGTLLFVSRALVPTLQQGFGTGGKETSLAPDQANKLKRSLRILDSVPGSDVRVVAEPWLGACLSGVHRPRLTISAPLVELLDEEEVEAVLAHEAAHALHRDNPRGWFLLLLGSVMFYNPVALLALQRISQDVEMACDDGAVVRTGRPLALASALIKTVRVNMGTVLESISPAPVMWLSRLDARVQRSLVVGRARRLSHYRAPDDVPLRRLKLSLTALLLAALLFFVV